MGLQVYRVSYAMVRNHPVQVKLQFLLMVLLWDIKQARLNKNYQKGDGLVAYSVDETIRSIGAVAQGMKETDVVILNEMLKH